MVVAYGAGGASQQALGTTVMGGMIAVMILALLMVPVFFVSVQRVLVRDRDSAEETAVKQKGYGVAEPQKPRGLIRTGSLAGSYGSSSVTQFARL